MVTRVALIGLSGAGKSTVAEHLARRMGWASVDLDREVERRAGRSVGAIFEEGEPRFRELESLALAEAMQRPGPLVLACGGGILGSASNRELLRTRARVVWLQVDPESAAARLGNGAAAERPLLRGASAVDGLRTLLDARRAAYAEAADTAVDTAGLGPDEIARRIAERLPLA